MLTLLCRSLTRQLVKGEQDSSPPSRDEYGLSPAAQYQTLDSMTPRGRFSSPIPIELSKTSSAFLWTLLKVTYKYVFIVWDHMSQYKVASL